MRFSKVVLLTFLLFQAALGQEAPPRCIAFGSCVHQDKPQPIWNAVYAQRPELFVFLGDNIYGDTENMVELGEKYKRQFEHPDFALLRQTCPYIGIWDDHDYGANDAGVEWRYKDESKRLMLKFLQEPPDSPRRKRPGVYASYLRGPVGKRVQIILLDTRWFRTTLYKLPKEQAKARNKATGKGPYIVTPDPNAQVLGEAQWKWLEEQLRQPAEVRLIGSSIPILQEETCWETWDNYPHERERLYRLLASTKANGVIMLSGDSHRAEFSRVDQGVPYPLWELNSSGLSENAKSRPPNRNRLGRMFIGDNFGLVRFDWEPKDPQIILEIRDADNDLVMQNMIRLSELQAK